MVGPRQNSSMTRTRYFTASTLDGFIATDDHSLDWLITRDIDRGGPLNYDAFIADVGAVAMGRSTYDWLQEHAGDEPWAYEMPAWVFTHRDDEPRADADIRFTQADVGAVHAEMVSAVDGRDIFLVGGGDLVGQFADRGLLDEIIVSIAPVTIGSGQPLLARHVELRLVELAQNGEFACARYDVVRPTA